MLENIPRWELIEWMAWSKLRDDEDRQRDARSRAEQAADEMERKERAARERLSQTMRPIHG
jgi:hypothetical protein